MTRPTLVSYLIDLIGFAAMGAALWWGLQLSIAWTLAGVLVLAIVAALLAPDDEPHEWADKRAEYEYTEQLQRETKYARMDVRV